MTYYANKFGMVFGYAHNTVDLLIYCGQFKIEHFSNHAFVWFDGGFIACR